jgi:Tol biopolymer transport system component
MRSTIAHHPGVRRPRLALAAFLATAAALTLAGCGDDPVAPDSIANEPVPAAADAGNAASGVEAVEPVTAALTSVPIAFMSYRIGDHPDIYRMDANGNAVTRLTTFSGDESAPAFSWNHQRIAMVRRRLDASKVEHEDIYIMNADGSNKHWALASPHSFTILDPSWSPDGARLVVTVIVQDNSYLAVMTPSTGAFNYVISDGHLVEGRYASFSPSGTSLLFVDPTGLKIREAYLDGDGYDLVNAGVSVGKPTYSPDGKSFAYSRALPGTSNMEIYVQNRATYVSKRLTFSSSFDGQPTYSPDGTRIAFESQRSGKTQIWTMSATGGTATRITHTTTIEAWPSWSH